jgi:membrane fusion protein (multidrug efflux system)
LVGLVIENEQMHSIYESLARIAKTSIAVLLLGETGAGKEVVAAWLHRSSERPENKFVRAEVESSGSRLYMQSAALEIVRVRAAGVYEAKVALARGAELLRMLAELESLSAVTRAALATLAARLETRKLIAPAAGRLGNIAALQVGDVVKAGDVIATVIPRDDVRVVAEFKPEDAVGRILPNQGAKLRLHGFSWLEFGMIGATVRKVANEPADGSIRVELSVDAAFLSKIPLQHGLPGSVDVLVDRVAPWSLLLRSVGAALMRERGQ